MYMMRVVLLAGYLEGSSSQLLCHNTLECCKALSSALWGPTSWQVDHIMQLQVGDMVQWEELWLARTAHWEKPALPDPLCPEVPYILGNN